MSELSGKQAATARNIHATLLRSVNDIGCTNLAADLGVNKSTISRMKEQGGKFEEIAKYIALLDLNLVENTDRICPDGSAPVPIPIVIKARTIVADTLGVDSQFIKDCDKMLRSVGIIKRDSDGELSIPLKYLK